MTDPHWLELTNNCIMATHTRVFLQQLREQVRRLGRHLARAVGELVDQQLEEKLFALGRGAEQLGNVRENL